MLGPSNLVINYHKITISTPTVVDLSDKSHIETADGEIALITNYVANVDSVTLVTVAGNPEVVLKFEIGQELALISSIGDSELITVLDYEYYYVKGMTVMGASRSEIRAVSVNENHSLQVGYKDGDPHVDMWGTLISSDAQVIGLHSVIDPGDVTVVATGAGSISSNTVAGLGVLSAGTSADSIMATTNLYHAHIPGFGLKAIVPAKLSNINENTTYRWGYYDDDNGYFFEQLGLNLNFVIRSSVTGVMVEQRIPQSEWNRDRMDGSGSPYNPSLIDINNNNYHLFFINLMNRAISAVNFGFYRGNGEEVTFHSIETSNDKTLPPVRTTELPVRWEVINTGIVSGGDAELSTAGTLVQMAGNTTTLNTSSIESNHSWFRPTLSSSNSNTDWTHLGSFRAGAISPITSETNRYKTVPQFVSYFIENAPSQVIITVNAPLSGPAWTQAHPTSALEYDITGTIAGQNYGTLVFSRFYQAGTHIVDVHDIFNKFGKNMITKADGQPGFTYSFFIRKIGANASATNVSLAVDWIDF